MSAFQCSDNHLAAIAFASVDRPLTDLPMVTCRFRDLFRANAISVDYRYKTPGTEPDEAPERTLTLEDYQRIEKYIRDPVAMLKLISCFEYQSCEHPGFESSDGYRWAMHARSNMEHALSGYRDAPWTID